MFIKGDESNTQHGAFRLKFFLILTKKEQQNIKQGIFIDVNFIRGKSRSLFNLGLFPTSEVKDHHLMIRNELKTLAED